MVTNYKRKTDPLDLNRVKAHMKNLIEQGKKVEKKAEETYEYFKKFVDGEPGTETDTSKKCMIDALKLQKESRQYSLKIFELLIRMFMAEGLPKKGGKNAIPQTLEELLGDE